MIFFSFQVHYFAVQIVWIESWKLVQFCLVIRQSWNHVSWQEPPHSLKINVLYRKNLNIDWLQTNNELMVYLLNDTKHQIIGLLDIVLTMFLLNQQIL